MTTGISAGHKKRFAEMKLQLSQLGSRESAFIQIELIFFEVLTISRSYGSEPEENGLLAALKNLQADEYAATAERFAKATQREKAIRRFINGLRNILMKGMSDSFVLAKTNT